MLKIRRDDEVIVIAGKDNGKRGKVVKVLADNRVIITGINMVKKHQKPNPQLQQPGGIVEKEAGIQVSNVAIWNPKTEKADRVGFKVEGETKVRVFKSTGEVIA
ncbi:MAG: large subunit ribosomal protein L24 [Oleispira sp.]|jgi:large subunit ribosomal protein L24|nr:50S ribosomal protein L24 [Oleispira sp.]MBL4799006.1 50S ribosomal protein L24 [Oleispira sp.]MBL4882647.1 50S ribosomal protein L24 [Oleispira sp.]|tara:strand:+ start:2254 stop:2565 length:312 start_codon:yes stop_codon:yes gene_type:complete